MTRTLHEQYLATTDLLALGMGSCDSVAAGYPLTLGFAYPYVEGGVVLRRRSLYPTPEDEYTYCGLSRDNETTLSSNDSVGHASDQAYEYSAARVLGNGFASEWSPGIRVDFDTAGNLIVPAMPTSPVMLYAEPIAGSAFEISWAYDPMGQGGWPTDFQVFDGADAASIDYATPLVDAVTGLAYVPFRTDLSVFSLVTLPVTPGSTHVFAVRGRNANGVAEQNTFTTEPTRAGGAPPAKGSIDRFKVRR